MPKRDKDWIGNYKTVVGTGGFSNHSEKEREKDDYYATDPIAVRLLMELEDFEGTISEVACGGGHLSKEMEKMGYIVHSTDLVDRGYGKGGG